MQETGREGKVNALESQISRGIIHRSIAFYGLLIFSAGEDKKCHR